MEICVDHHVVKNASRIRFEWFDIGKKYVRTKDKKGLEEETEMYQHSVHYDILLIHVFYGKWVRGFMRRYN